MTARVLGSVLGVPVHGVCSLDIIAASAAAARPGREFLVATDARRKEVYWARYDAAGRRVAGPGVGPASSIPAPRTWPVAGTGGLLYPAAFGEVIGPAYPDAGTLCQLVAASLAAPALLAPAPARWLRPGSAGPGPPPLLPAEPLYLRRPDAREPGPPKRVTPGQPEGAAPQIPHRAMTAQTEGSGCGRWPRLTCLPSWRWSRSSSRRTPGPRRCSRRELAQPASHRLYLVAEEGDTLIGYAGMMFTGGPQADVVTLAVDPARWGRGTGTALLSALVAEAARRGCTEVLLEVRKDNPRARQLYLRHGFAEIGIRRGYYQPSGVDAVVMRKVLP